MSLPPTLLPTALLAEPGRFSPTLTERSVHRLGHPTPAVKAPEDRYIAIVGDTSNGFNATFWDFYTTYFANDKAVLGALDAIAASRALTEDKEMMGEIRVSFVTPPGKVYATIVAH